MLATFLVIELAVLLIGFLLAIAYLAMTGRIEIRGFLLDLADADQLSIGRIQLLIFVLAVAGTYAGQLMANQHRFPTIPPGFLLTYAGSNVAYLGAKAKPVISGVSMRGFK